MNKPRLPWEEKPISTIIEIFDCTVQHIEDIGGELHGIDTMESGSE